MRKIIAFFAAALVASFFCLQSSAWSNPSLLLQIIPVLAASNRASDTTEILIGDQGIITVFKGKQVHSAIEILVDSSGYDFDPEIVKAMAAWIQETSGRLGDISSLTRENLLDGQKTFDGYSMVYSAVDACVRDR